MKFLLIVPTFNYTALYPSFLSISDFPVGFAYLASSLRAAGFEVYGLNLNNTPGYRSAHEMVRDGIRRSIDSVGPDVICTGGICIDYSFLKDAISAVREFAPQVPIVLGGGIVSNDPEFIFKTLKPDFGIVGEGEEVLVQLAFALKEGRSHFEQIPNLLYWNRGLPKLTRQDFNYVDLDQRAFPDYEPFGIGEMLDRFSMATRSLYRYSRLNPRPVTLVAARSCPFNCTFCVHQRGARYRHRSIPNILAEIAVLYYKYEFNILIILDELFAAHKARLREFSEAVLQAKSIYGWDFDWMFQTHASASFDMETLDIAKEAGCYFFSYGLESASPSVLASMNKRVRPSQFIEAIRAADSVRIGFGGNFIFGDFAETPLTIAQTMAFFNQYCMDIHIFLARIQPYPGSKIFDRCLEKGLIRDKLSYYERISALSVNMTKIPDLVLLLWFTALRYFRVSFFWVQSVEATSIERVKEMDSSPITYETGAGVYEIEVNCPICRKRLKIWELLTEKAPVASSLKALVEMKVLQGRVFFQLFCLAVSMLSLPIFRPFNEMFKFFKARGAYSYPSTATGCPNCNKRIKIRLSKLKNSVR